MRDRPLYDDLGLTYTSTRHEDPRLAAAVINALGDAQAVVNVGAGPGAYEPSDREVIAIEPSAVMTAQRPPEAAPAVRATAEALPLPDKSVDAAMAVFSDHHWGDRDAGLRELARVTRDRVVLVNCDPAAATRFWLATEYLPRSLDLFPSRLCTPGAWQAETAAALGAPVQIRPWPIPHDCRDGFYGAYWRRPQAYLDAHVRAGISAFGLLHPDDVSAGLARLAQDLDSGVWQARHADLLRADELDLGYFVAVAELGR